MESSDNCSLPVIRLELGGVRHTVMRALAEHNLQMDQYVQEALEQELSDEHVKLIVRKAVRDAMNLILDNTVQAFLTYGGGRAILNNAITESLRAAARFESEAKANVELDLFGKKSSKKKVRKKAKK